MKLENGGKAKKITISLQYTVMPFVHILYDLMHHFQTFLNSQKLVMIKYILMFYLDEDL